MNLPNRRLVLGFAGVVGLASLLLVLALGYTGSPPTQATNQSADTEMSIVVTGESAGSAVTCDSSSVASCTLDPDSAFLVEIVARTIPPGGFGFWQTLLTYGSLEYKPRAFSTDEIPWDLSFLPLRAPNPAPPEAESVGHGDTSSLGIGGAPLPRSVAKAALVELDFNCGAADTGDILEMTDFDVRPDGSVYGGEFAEEIFVPALSSLVINCQPPPPTPTATPPPTACPTGKVPITGGCGTPTETPEAPPAPTVTPTPENVCGDIDGDQNVSSVDSLWALWWVADLVDEVPVEKAGDVNGDGEITALDATLILQFEASLIPALLC